MERPGTFLDLVIAKWHPKTLLSTSLHGWSVAHRAPPLVACKDSTFPRWIQRVKRMLKEAKRHLHFVISIYNMQLAAGRHFLHEHPVGASSWKDEFMEKVLKHPRVGTSVADQCMYGLMTMDGNGNLVEAQKPTKWASSSRQMLERLSTRCDKSHSHQHLVGGRAAAAAYYPAKLISQILRGMRDTADAEHKEREWSTEMSIAMALGCYGLGLLKAFQQSDSTKPFCVPMRCQVVRRPAL